MHPVSTVIYVDRRSDTSLHLNKFNTILKCYRHRYLCKYVYVMSFNKIYDFYYDSVEGIAMKIMLLEKSLHRGLTKNINYSFKIKH